MNVSDCKEQLDVVQKLHRAEILKHVQPHAKSLNGVFKPVLVAMGTMFSAFAGFVYRRRRW
jgi:hypothetical protein